MAEDLSFGNTSWNGLSELLELARASGPVVASRELDPTKLEATDALLIVHPVAPLPTAALAKFLRRGGRLAVADDFGTGRELFAAFGMGMHGPGRSSVRSLRGNPELLLATPVRGHSLADGADALVTNHPQVIFHPDLTPVFAISEGHGAIVLSGSVGKGRLVAISDASALINNMLEFRGNRAFANNLLRFLRAGQGRRLYVAGSDTQWLSGFRNFTTGNPLARVSAVLNELARPRLPPLAVLALSAVLALILLTAAGTALPRRSAYARRAYLRTPECVAGLAGRVSYHAAPHRNCLAPTLLLKHELEHQLVTRLRLRGQPERKDVLAALRASGLREASIEALTELMRSLDRVQDQALSADPQISAKQFSELTAVGRRILAELDAAPHPDHERHERSPNT